MQGKYRSTTNIIRITLIWAIVSASIALSSNSAYACSCAAPRTPAEAFPEYDAIFTGLVTSVDLEEPTDSFERKVVSFDVNESWKGIEGQAVVVHTATHGAMCGYHFEVGESYLVYSSIQETVSPDELWTHICTRTDPLEEAAEDLLYLRASIELTSQIRILLSFISTLLE